MKRIVCEMCESTDLVKEDGFYVCRSCGTKYSVEEAKKLMIGGSLDVSGSTIKVDISEKLNNLIQLAHRAKDNNDIENAQKYYELIAMEDTNNWEAYFYSVYFKSANCKIGQIALAATNLKRCIESSFKLIKENVEPQKQKEAYMEVDKSVLSVGTMFLKAANNHYEKNSSVSGTHMEYINRVNAVLGLFMEVADQLNAIFGEKEEAAKIYKLVPQIRDNYKSSSFLYGGEYLIHTRPIVELAEKKHLLVDPEYARRLENNERQDKINVLVSAINETNEKIDALSASRFILRCVIRFVVCEIIAKGCFAMVDFAQNNSYMGGAVCDFLGKIFVLVGVIMLLNIFRYGSKKETIMQMEKNVRQWEEELSELRKK